MRALVTGASGHLGSSVIRELLFRHAEVAALVRPSTDLWRISDVAPDVTIIRGAVSSEETAHAVCEFAPVVVIHCARSGVGRDSRESPAQIHENVPFALELFRLAASAGAKRWVGLGSQAEYGPVGGMLREPLPASPTTAYGVAKVGVAALTQKLAQLSSMDHVWLRLLETYGPADDDRFLIPMLINHFLSGRTPQLTSGSQLVDYLFVADAAEAIVDAAGTAGMSGVFNLASGESLSVRALAELVRDIVSPGAEIDVAADGARIPDLCADVSRLRHATGWTPRTPLTEGLAVTARWYAEHREHGAHS